LATASTRNGNEGLDGSRLQRTLANKVEFTGVGLHTGRETKMVLHPAEDGAGITFVRVDLEGEPEVPVSPNYIKTRERRTCLHHGRAEVFTVEHVLATLSALRIDNVEIQIDGDEVPGMDGSAKEFAERLKDAGAVEQRAPKRRYAVREPVFVRDGDSTLVALPGTGGLTIDYSLEYPDGLGDLSATRQTVRFELGEHSFVEEIASARTWVFEHEVEQLVAAGLGKGANYQNTLVLGPAGVKENELRCRDEMPRHKVLDLIGDLSVLGTDLDAHIIATRSGHALNVKLAAMLLEEIEADEVSGEVAHETGLEIREIINLLPHRYPFLLIDRVIELDGYRRAVGIKNVTINEPYFQGHWPGEPIMPGVLQLEAMAQLSGVLLLRKLENTGKLAVLWSIDKVKLRGAVTPGDQLRIEVDTIRAKPKLGHVQARCKVGGRLVAEAQFKFTLIDA